MGNSHCCRVNEFNYEKDLLSDTVPRSVEVKEEEPSPDCGVPRRHIDFADKFVIDMDPSFDNGKG